MKITPGLVGEKAPHVLWAPYVGADTKIDLDGYEKPIFVSAPTYGAHNTCGAFSPTRPGVIFIMKTNGIDVWDFLDQSNKPSLTFNFATSPFMYCKF
jgi:hypothetical protein